MASNKGHKGEIQSIEFRPAKGGIVSETSTKYKRGGQGGGPDFDYERETAVHATPEHAAKHLSKVMGHCFGEGSSKEDNKAAKAED